MIEICERESVENLWQILENLWHGIGPARVDPYGLISRFWQRGLVLTFASSRPILLQALTIASILGDIAK